MNRPYHAIIRPISGQPLTHSFNAENFFEAWAQALEAYPEAKVHVGCYYSVISDGEKSTVCEESDLASARLRGFTPRSEPRFAMTWLQAKRDFGFDLTPMQQELLAKQEALL